MVVVRGKTQIYMLLDSIGYQATAPGTSGAAAAAVTGDSLTVKNASAGSSIYLVTLLGLNQGAGFHQVTAPSFNDTTRGIRVGLAAATAGPIIPIDTTQSLTPQETLSVTIAGSATAGDIESGVAIIWYDDLPGQSGIYISDDDLYARAVRQVTVYATLSTGTTGGWSGSELITAESDLLRANTPYAVLGITTSVAACAIGIRAPDWANARAVVPGTITRPEMGATWFQRLTERTGKPCIPVFNSANRGNVLLDALVDENGSDPIVSVMLVELAS